MLSNGDKSNPSESQQPWISEELRDVPGGHRQLWETSLTSRVFGSRAASFCERQEQTNVRLKLLFTQLNISLKSHLSDGHSYEV